MGVAKKPKRPQRYAMLPNEVMTSDAMKKIGDTGFKVVAALAGQFNGYNNGGLELTKAIADEYGISEQRRKLFLKAAEIVGLIEITVPATKIGRGKGRPNKYALTFQPLSEFQSFGIKRTLKASNKWAKYVLEGTPIKSVPDAQRFLGYKVNNSAFKDMPTAKILEGQRSNDPDISCIEDKHITRKPRVSDKRLSRIGVTPYLDKKTA